MGSPARISVCLSELTFTRKLPIARVGLPR
jgi:hypothetical protein